MSGQFFFGVKNQPPHIDTLTNVYFCYNLGAHEKELNKTYRSEMGLFFPHQTCKLDPCKYVLVNEVFWGLKRFQPYLAHSRIKFIPHKM